MAKKVRTHIVNDALSPSHLTKFDFGQRIYSLMAAKGWTQAELSRRSGVPRDAISTYIRGKFLPSRENLQGLAQAFGKTAEELLPNVVESSIEDDNPALEMKISPNAPNVAWLRVNRLVTTATALKIMELLNDDKPLTPGK